MLLDVLVSTLDFFTNRRVAHRSHLKHTTRPGCTTFEEYSILRLHSVVDRSRTLSYSSCQHEQLVSRKTEKWPCLPTQRNRLYKSPGSSTVTSYTFPRGRKFFSLCEPLLVPPAPACLDLCPLATLCGTSVHITVYIGTVHRQSGRSCSHAETEEPRQRNYSRSYGRLRGPLKRELSVADGSNYIVVRADNPSTL